MLRAVRFSTVLRWTAQYIAVLPSTGQCCQVLRSTAKYCEVLRSTAKYCELLPNTECCEYSGGLRRRMPSSGRRSSALLSLSKRSRQRTRSACASSDYPCPCSDNPYPYFDYRCPYSECPIICAIVTTHNLTHISDPSDISAGRSCGLGLSSGAVRTP
jgi:hypothetical protein